MLRRASLEEVRDGGGMMWGGVAMGVGVYKTDSQLRARCLYSQSWRVAGEERAKGKKEGELKESEGRAGALWRYCGVGWMDG